MGVMYLNEWDFTDTSLDLRLFAGLQSFDLSSIPEYVAEEDEAYEENEENEEYITDHQGK